MEVRASCPNNLLLNTNLVISSICVSPLNSFILEKTSRQNCACLWFPLLEIFIKLPQIQEEIADILVASEVTKSRSEEYPASVLNKCSALSTISFIISSLSLSQVNCSRVVSKKSFLNCRCKVCRCPFVPQKLVSLSEICPCLAGIQAKCQV